MKVQIRFSGDKYHAGDEYQASCEVDVDGVTIARGMNLSECPEDANLGRDFNFVYELPKVLRKAHQAGLNGEAFEIEEVENAE